MTGGPWRLLPVLCAVSAVCGCDGAPGRGSEEAPGGVPEAASLASDSLIRAGAVQPFAYVLLGSADFDLDGDGESERIELLATVERDAGGRPIWEDGHHWVVRVRDGGLDYPLLERFVPFGYAEFAVVHPPEDPVPAVIVQTRSGAGCGGGEAHIALTVERFVFDAREGAFARETAIEASGLGMCVTGRER